MLELLISAFEPQVFLANLVGEVTNDASAKVAFFAIKSFGIALLGMASNLRQPGMSAKRSVSKHRKRKPKPLLKRSIRRHV